MLKERERQREQQHCYKIEQPTYIQMVIKMQEAFLEQLCFLNINSLCVECTYYSSNNYNWWTEKQLAPFLCTELIDMQRYWMQ